MVAEHDHDHSKTTSGEARQGHCGIADSDMLASFAVVVAGLVIQFTAWHQIDSIVSMLIALALIPRTRILLMQCAHVLMEGTPDHKQSTIYASPFYLRKE